MLSKTISVCSNLSLLNLLLALILLFLFVSCNITYKVRNQFFDIEHKFSFPCGYAYVQLIGKGNSIFTVRQKFNVQSEIYINIDSLKISYNHKPVAYDHTLRDSKSAKGNFKIENRKSLDFSFNLDESVFEGDTIIVYGEGYIRCNNELLALDSLVYSFRNNFRIVGVNDF